MSVPSPTEATPRRDWPGLVLVAPALLVVVLFFVLPLGLSLVTAFQLRDGTWSTGNFAKALDLYRSDLVFTAALVGAATLLTGLFAVLIGGWLTLGDHPASLAVLRWLYRLPLFVPFVVAAQTMNSFLAKNGLMNHALVSLGLIGPLQAQSFLDWRGVLATFVWKQTPFVALMVAGAMAALDRGLIEAARNCGASRPRILLEILVPLVRPTLLVGLVLSFVTMLSVLSVPVMLNAGSPTLITVDMAFRITAHGDYGVANALGFLSCAMAGFAAWLYLRLSLAQRTRG
jgi:ABC-type spermidine/putrescine transport system permease subunit I